MCWLWRNHTCDCFTHVPVWCTHTHTVSSTHGHSSWRHTAAAALFGFQQLHNCLCCQDAHRLTDLYTNTNTHTHYSITTFTMYISLLLFNDCNNCVGRSVDSLLPQQSSWQWAGWWPGSGGAGVWQWLAHSRRTGSRKKWQSGQFLQINVYSFAFYIL